MSDSATKAYVDNVVSGLSVTSSATASVSGSIAATSAASITSTGITLSTAGGLIYNQASVFGLLTLEEIKELDALEQEYKGTLKTRRIQIFKSMPSNLRQQIVDYFIIKDSVAKMESPPEDPEWSRLYELRRKDSRVGINNYAYKTWAGSNSIFEIILNYMTEEEIFNAHAEQSLEESLLNTKTDSI